MSRPPQGRAPHNRQPSRLLGYGADASRRRSARARRNVLQGPKVQAGNSRLTEFAAWLATTALAGALILLLAQFDLLLALPVLLVYALFSVLLWRGRWNKTKKRP